MRRKEKEITELEDIKQVISSCSYCDLAIMDSEYPYIVPMNFGVEYNDGQISLYFHGATKGTKVDLLNSNKKVAFSMCTEYSLKEGNSPCNFSMSYKSICGKGNVSFLDGMDKKHALSIIMKQYVKDFSYEFKNEQLDGLMVFRVDVIEIKGKKS